MATASKRRLPYHRRLFLLLLIFAGTLAGCFVAFQYNREKHFKVIQLDARLQRFNLRMLDALRDGIAPEVFIARNAKPIEELRLTLIDTLGRVFFDTSGDSVAATNHLGRPEVAAALRDGMGYTIRRLSESTRRDYFYSAMRGDDYIVRSAAPYSVTLREMLAADHGFLWFMAAATLLLIAGGYLATRRLGRSIKRLNDFAQRAERGERITDETIFPHDELGDLSSHIVSLYARLQQAQDDRNREHALALHEEQEKIRIKKQLTNNINHELKTPVAAIQGYLETLVTNPTLDAAHRTSFLENSLSQTLRLGSLLADVATITRMDEASELIRMEPVCLNEIIAQLTTEMELRPVDQQLRVHCDFPENLTTTGSHTLLTSLFCNLADNAAAYSGGRDIFIRLEEQTPDWLTIHFADNGIGVSEEHLPHLFERFYRIDKGRSRKYGGTGLGLAIVRNAVAIHGGEISVSNRPQGGLEFVFTLQRG